MQPRPRRDRRSPRRSGSASCPSHLPLRRGRSGNKGLMRNEGSGVCWGAMLCRWLPTKGSRSALSPSAPSPGAGILTNAPSCTREMWVESSSAETCSEGGVRLGTPTSGTQTGCRTALLRTGLCGGRRACARQPSRCAALQPSALLLARSRDRPRTPGLRPTPRNQRANPGTNLLFVLPCPTRALLAVWRQVCFLHPSQSVGGGELLEGTLHPWDSANEGGVGTTQTAPTPS